LLKNLFPCQRIFPSGCFPKLSFKNKIDVSFTIHFRFEREFDGLFVFKETINMNVPRILLHGAFEFFVEQQHPSTTKYFLAAFRFF
jgi:hypothetical protein